jgi:2-phosphosulfolactate phosphatase
MADYFDQQEYSIRFEWGLAGLKTLAPVSEVVVIVDVLSFTTSVDIVVANGGFVIPYHGEAGALEAFAYRIGAISASKTRHKAGAYSLAPSSLVSIPPGTRLVLPSLNGSRLSLEAGQASVLAGCLRSARATAARASQLGKRISVIAAGEQWKDGALRPCLEDLIGAGAVIAHLAGFRSPEAEMAVGVYTQAAGSLFDILIRCGSGKELAAQGFTEDVRLASELNTSRCAPQLLEGMYQDSSL